MVNPDRSAYNNIIAFTFLTSIAVGSLFFVAIEFLSGAVWSTPFRRVGEFLSALIIVLPLLFIPLLFNVDKVFHWTHPEPADKILIGKAPYLNVTFFIVRIVVFFLLWLLFYYLITRNSRKQDLSKDSGLTSRNVKISAVFMPVFAITITFTAIDWLMSLEPHWFSTIFGIYYFSGTVLAALAAATIFIILLDKKGFFVKGIHTDSYYSLGALLFAFTNFWAYIAFSQFLLIWYANLPEETFWFLARWDGGWKYASIGLIIIQFLVPYMGLLSQPSKMNPKRLLIMSGVLLFAHYYDLYWLVMPNYEKGSVPFGWIELGFPILIAGLVITVFYYKSKNENLVPIGDPKLKRGIDFRL
ncbi:MAG: quinol:cytochrome C oxidoreductase [Ignavibacteriae bacterium HGW-Ignavibacteriae-3]|nr:MAG: quinol:cytochrome C oxidoreductase [Ignavibacteriae bacterium HGW-Ignavibacteriae-3]